MFPAALAIVVNTFPLRERGKALALFFGIAGGLTALGPILGGYLTEWTWRAIFWVNIPVALIALVLIAVSRPKTEYRRAPIDYRGAVLIAAGIGLSIFGLQQSVPWGWSNPWTWICIVGGLAIIVLFVFVELRTESPLIAVTIFRIRAFTVENLVLMISMMAFIPIFFFSSEYAQIALHKTASEAGLFLLFFFLGFVVAAQIGGRLLDREGAKRAVVVGCAIAAVGFGIWASKATVLDFGQQRIWVVVAGAGMGMMLGPANTDAVNRAGNLSYGEATGITQTIRNYGASLGLAALGTILLFTFRSHLTTTLSSMGVPHAATVADRISQSQQGSGSVATIPHYVSVDFAPRHPDGALRHVRDHGRRRCDRPGRAPTRTAGDGAPRRGAGRDGGRPGLNDRPGPRGPPGASGASKRAAGTGPHGDGPFCRELQADANVAACRNRTAGFPSLLRRSTTGGRACHVTPDASGSPWPPSRWWGCSAPGAASSARSATPCTTSRATRRPSTRSPRTCNRGRAPRSRPPTRRPAARRPPSSTPSIPRAVDWPSTPRRRAPTPRTCS